MKKVEKPKSKWKSILRFVLLIICGAVFGMNIYSANANSLVGNKLPMPFGYGAAVVLSGSMEPTFSTGDLIIVKEAEQFKVDDIVVYQTGGDLIVHRIIEVKEDSYITKGDANNTPDEPIAASAMKGTVMVAIPAVGTAVNFLKTPIGTIIVIAAAIALVEVPRRREKEKDDEERQKIIDEIRKLKEQE